MECEKRGFESSDCLTLRDCKKFLVDRNDITYVSKALPRLMSFRESNRYVHTILKSSFRNPNARKWQFFRFDTPSGAYFEGAIWQYCDPPLHFQTP